MEKGEGEPAVETRELVSVRESADSPPNKFWRPLTHARADGRTDGTEYGRLDLFSFILFAFTRHQSYFSRLLPSFSQQIPEFTISDFLISKFSVIFFSFSYLLRRRRITASATHQSLGGKRDLCSKRK